MIQCCKAFLFTFPQSFVRMWETVLSLETSSEQVLFYSRFSSYQRLSHFGNKIV